ncbi:MAG: hypothetical protein ABSH32_21630 [Bryobacteraceae bacterium]
MSVFLSIESVLLAGLDVAGICMLTAGHVYDCPYGLTLVQDSEDHAEIMGVPLRAEDEKRAMDIADYLVKVAEDVPLPKRQSAI